MKPILAHWITGHQPAEHDLDEAVRLEAEADAWRICAYHHYDRLRIAEGLKAEATADERLERSRRLSAARADGRASRAEPGPTAPLRLAA